MILLRTFYSSYILDLNILSNFTIPYDAYLNANLSIYINQSLNGTEDLIETDVELTKRNSFKDKDYEISNFQSQGYKIDNLIYKYDNYRIKVTNLEIFGTSKNYTEIYELKIIYGDYADTRNQPSVDFKDIFYGSPYDINVYKVENISSCNQDYTFNLTLDKNSVDNEEQINITFYGKGNKKSFILKSECALTIKYKNLMLCKAERETPNYNYTMNNYLNINKTKLIFISSEYIFPFFCSEYPPIAATIVFSCVFVFVFVVVIILIIFLNRRGKGEEEYDGPNNNSNNIIGLSSGAISK